MRLFFVKRISKQDIFNTVSCVIHLLGEVALGIGCPKSFVVDNSLHECTVGFASDGVCECFGALLVRMRSYIVQINCCRRVLR